MEWLRNWPSLPTQTTTPCGPSWHRPWATAANGQEIAPSLEDRELWHHSSTTWVRFLWSIAFCYWQIVCTLIFGCPWHPYTYSLGSVNSYKRELVFRDLGDVAPLVSDQLIRNSNSTCFCMTVKAYATKNPTFYNYFNQFQNSKLDPSCRKRKISLWFWFSCCTEATVNKKWVDVCLLQQAGSSWNFRSVLWWLN